MKKLRVEIWRIVKFFVITFVINLVRSLVNGSITNALVASSSVPTGRILSLLSWVFIIITTLVATLLNRYFTFRATEPWYIALPLMLLVALGWQLLETFPLALASRYNPRMVISTTSLLSFIWMILSYLFQRYVIYCHTTDQNGWYHRLHPANEE